MKKYATVAELLRDAPPDKRKTLNSLRNTIKAAAPGATEAINYGVLISYKHAGKYVVFIGFAKEHVAVYGAAVSKHAGELKAYDVSKGTIRFPAARPISARLLTKIVKRRVAEIDATGR